MLESTHETTRIGHPCLVGANGSPTCSMLREYKREATNHRLFGYASSFFFRPTTGKSLAGVTMLLKACSVHCLGPPLQQLQGRSAAASMRTQASREAAVAEPFSCRGVRPPLDDCAVMAMHSWVQELYFTSPCMDPRGMSRRSPEA